MLRADGSLWCRCVSIPISEHIHNAWWSRGDHVGLALSCLISNGRLPGDSACQPPEPPVLLTSAIWAAQPHSISGARAEAGAGLDPSPPGLPLALPQGMSCPLPAAHTRSEDTTAAAYLSLAATSAGSSEMRCINLEERPSKKSINNTEPTKWSTLQSHFTLSALNSCG